MSLFFKPVVPHSTICPTMIRLRTLISYPWFMDHGGGARVGQNLTEALIQKGCEVGPLDYGAFTEDFDGVLVFGCQHVNSELLHYLRGRGKRVVVLPIYDRPRSLALLKAFRFLHRAPFQNDYRHRASVFAAAHVVACANAAEAADVAALYRVRPEQIQVVHHGVDESFLSLGDRLPENAFAENYPGWSDFVFFPAAQISPRKGQLELLHALAGTGVPVVVNNTHLVPEAMKANFEKALAQNRVLALGALDRPALAACYRSAKVSVSLSNSETAGLANLEALYFGCHLLVNDLPAFREYLGPHGHFVRRNKPREVRKAIHQLLSQNHRATEGRGYVAGHYRWAAVAERYLGFFKT